MNIVNDLIEPLSIEDFRESYLCNKPYAAAFKALKIKNEIPNELIQRVLESGHDDCWLVKKGQLFTSALGQGRLSLIEATVGFKNGYTILLRNFEEIIPEVALIKNDFEKAFGLPADVQLYCTPESEEGLAWHFDHEEVFVLQCAGEKEFFIRRTMEVKPTAEVRCTLKAGDFLYIPSRFWHKARANSYSIHISIGVTARPKVML